MRENSSLISDEYNFLIDLGQCFKNRIGYRTSEGTDSSVEPLGHWSNHITKPDNKNQDLRISYYLLIKIFIVFFIYTKISIID
jgi:hypothetical protein